MGVDFRMQAVRPLREGRFEPIPGEGFEFWSRLAMLETLFRPGHQEGSPAPLLRSLLPDSVSFRWFEDAYSGAYYEKPPATTADCFPPREVVECMQAVLRVLRDRADALPSLYFLREPRTGDRRGGLTAVYEDRVYAIRGDWGRCEATPADADQNIPYPKGDRTIDLRGVTAIRCRPIALAIFPSKVGDSMGIESSFRIETESCLDRFGPALEAMRSVADRAQTRDDLVFTFLS